LFSLVTTIAEVIELRIISLKNTEIMAIAFRIVGETQLESKSKSLETGEERVNHHLPSPDNSLCHSPPVLEIDYL